MGCTQHSARCMRSRIDYWLSAERTHTLLTVCRWQAETPVESASTNSFVNCERHNFIKKQNKFPYPVSLVTVTHKSVSVAARCLCRLSSVSIIYACMFGACADFSGSVSEPCARIQEKSRKLRVATFIWIALQKMVSHRVPSTHASHIACAQHSTIERRIEERIARAQDTAWKWIHEFQRNLPGDEGRDTHPYTTNFVEHKFRKYSKSRRGYNFI